MTAEKAVSETREGDADIAPTARVADAPPAVVPRVVSFVGKSGSGKTTLLEGVIRLLSERGLRVGVVKHHGHDVELDVPRKDSWRHAQAGAVTTIVSSPSQFALVQRVEGERTLAELIEMMPDVDIVLTEGFRAQAVGCIEVLRGANSIEPVCQLSQLSAIVTDVPRESLPAPLAAAEAEGMLYIFGLDDVEAVADAIAEGELPGTAER